MGRFTKGLFFGGLFGAGFAWLNVTAKGKEMRKQLLDHAAVAYEEVKEKLGASRAWKDMSQSDYAKIVKDVMDKYAVKTGLAANVKRMVEKVVRMQWKSILRQLTEEEKLVK